MLERFRAPSRRPALHFAFHVVTRGEMRALERKNPIAVLWKQNAYLRNAKLRR